MSGTDLHAATVCRYHKTIRWWTVHPDLIPEVGMAEPEVLDRVAVRSGSLAAVEFYRSRQEGHPWDGRKRQTRKSA